MWKGYGSCILRWWHRKLLNLIWKKIKAKLMFSTQNWSNLDKFGLFFHPHPWCRCWNFCSWTKGGKIDWRNGWKILKHNRIAWHYWLEPFWNMLKLSCVKKKWPGPVFPTDVALVSQSPLIDMCPVTIMFWPRNLDGLTAGCGLSSFPWLVTQCFLLADSGPQILSKFAKRTSHYCQKRGEKLH